MSETTNGAVVTEEQTVACLRKLAESALELPPEQADRLHMDTPLVDGFELDSLKQVILMAAIEESFGFEFSPDDLHRAQDLVTVGDLVHIVQERATVVPAST